MEAKMSKDLLEDLDPVIEENQKIEKLQEKRPSPLRGMSPLLLLPYIMDMSMMDRMNGFLDTGDYNYISPGGGSNSKDSFGGRRGHKAKGYIESNKGFKKVEDIGRNDPCKCSSGKKFKKCCMNKQLEDK